MLIPDYPYRSERFAAIWVEWLQYRKERRIKTYTPTGLKRTLLAILRDSQGDEYCAIRMLEQSMEQGWQGIFPLKNTVNGKQPNNAPPTGTSASRIQGLKEW